MRRCRPALGTFVEIGVCVAPADGIDATGAGDGDGDGYAAIHAIDAAFSAIERVEARMSFHRPTSDLSRLNRAEAGDVLALDPWTVEVLVLAAELHAATGGLFDCAVGNELIDAGLLPGVPRAGGSGSIADLEIVDASHVRLARPVCLDLGGIAKGAAVDRAVEALQACGMTQGSVNAGGDLRVFGPVAEPIAVRSPADPACSVEIGRLAAGAIATSSMAFSAGVHGGRRRSALIDPRTRAPVLDPRSFSVLAERCAVADGLTKALAVAGTLGADCLDRYGATVLVL